MPYSSYVIVLLKQPHRNKCEICIDKIAGSEIWANYEHLNGVSREPHTPYILIMVTLFIRRNSIQDVTHYVFLIHLLLHAGCASKFAFHFSVLISQLDCPCKLQLLRFIGYYTLHLEANFSLSCF